MEPQKETTAGHHDLLLELPSCGGAATFNLEKAVCSHGLFMMAPNHWDPFSNTFQRPLRLSLDFKNHDYERSLIVRISQPTESPHLLKIRVMGGQELDNNHQQALLAQVRRMFRLSEEENREVREFQEVYAEAKESGFGRIFRSPTLFEDMVKCILLCNCQWSRTLSMARALCELQSELRCPSISFDESRDGIDSCYREPKSKCENYIPKTPAGKEYKRKRGVSKLSTNLASKFAEVTDAVGSDLSLETDTDTVRASVLVKEMVRSAKTSNGGFLASSVSCPTEQPSGGIESYHDPAIGNFPSPRELANLDSQLLARRCSLGYRASRILNLAQSIMEGKIQLMELEASVPRLSSYEELTEKLKELNGFGPFTRANVLMCMGFYHVIPTDSETIRHLKQVHARKSTPQTVQRDVDLIYGKYKPFQFLVYWLEVWHFYEEWFGKMSEMSHDRYGLITAANMRLKGGRQTAKTRKKQCC